MVSLPVDGGPRGDRASLATRPVARRTPAGRGRIPVTAVLVIAALYFLIPVAWVLISATKSPADLFGTFGFWFSSHPQLLQNIGRLFSQDSGSYGIWLLNSLLYAGVGAFVAMVVSAGAGYAMAKYSFRGREALFSIVLGGVLVPATVIALPLYFLLNSVHLTGTYWSVLVPGMVSPFGVYLARIYASSSIPDELIEAARIDGAGDLRIFATIAGRIMAPALVTIFLFQFVGIWNNYLLPLVMLSDTNTFPVTLGLTLWNSQTQRDPIFYQLVVTGSAFSAVILAIVMVSLQRFWRAGLTSGATKG